MKLPSKAFFLFAVAALSLFLTIFGYVLQLAKPVTWPQSLDFFLIAVAQLTLNGFDVLDNSSGSGNGFIRSGRFAAVLFVVIAAGTLLNAIFHISSSVKLFLTKQSNHDLVIGLGWHGQELLSRPSPLENRALSLSQRIGWAADTIAIDPNPSELARELCRTKNIPLVETDALFKDVPILVGLPKVDRVFIATGSDALNIEIAFTLTNELQKRKVAGKRIVVAVNLQARKSFENLRGLIGENPNIDLHMFSNTVSTAQTLFSDSNYQIDRFNNSRPKNAHLVVIGDDVMAEELLRSSLQYSIFEEDSSLTVDVLCPRAQEFARRWSAEYTCYAAGAPEEKVPPSVYLLQPQKVWLEANVLPNIRFHELPESARGQIDWCGSFVKPANCVTTVIVAMQDPADSSEITESICAKLANLAQEVNNDIEIWVYSNNRNAELRTSLESKLKLKYNVLKPKVFFDYLGKFSAGIASGEEIDMVAKRVNAMYAITDIQFEDNKVGGTQKEINDSWYSINENDKDSSRQSAVHAFIKSRIKQRLVGPLTEAYKQKVLGKIEHRRWCAELLLKGYVPLTKIASNCELTKDESEMIFDWYNDKKKKNAFRAQRLHVCLLPYTDLVILLGKERGEKEQNKDHQIALLEWTLTGTPVKRES